MIESFPYLLVPERVTFAKAMSSRSGGRSITGSQQVVSSGGGGFWRASLTMPVFGETRSLAYRALYAALDGMAGEILVPCMTKWRPRDLNGAERHWSSAGGELLGGSGFSFADNTGLGQTEDVMMRTAAAAAVRSTQLLVAHPHVSMLRPGHYFGIGNRLYLVAKAWMIVSEKMIADDGGSLYYGDDGLLYGADGLVYGAPGLSTVVGENTSYVQFWPPLREAVPASTPLVLGRPVCRMRLASDDVDQLDLELGVIARPTMEFEEII